MKLQKEAEAASSPEEYFKTYLKIYTEKLEAAVRERKALYKTITGTYEGKMKYLDFLKQRNAGQESGFDKNFGEDYQRLVDLDNYIGLYEDVPNASFAIQSDLCFYYANNGIMPSIEDFDKRVGKVIQEHRAYIELIGVGLAMYGGMKYMSATSPGASKVSDRVTTSRTTDRYIPRDANGKPIPLRQQNVNGIDITLPDH